MIDDLKEIERLLTVALHSELLTDFSRSRILAALIRIRAMIASMAT